MQQKMSQKINSRSKGAANERWVVNAMNDYLNLHIPHLGFQMKRNLDQTRDGGYDILGLDEFAIEAKHYAKGCHYKSEWWEQVCRAAGNDQIPILVYKYNHKPQRVCVPLDWFFSAQFPISKDDFRQHTCVISWEDFLWFLVCYLGVQYEQ